jgi:hypothetical protein
MRQALLWLIRAYWRFRPERLRRSCLFRETCSRHVYRVTASSGILCGLEALGRRIRQCRQGYRVETLAGHLVLRLRDGSFLSESELSSNLLHPYSVAARGLEKVLLQSET